MTSLFSLFSSSNIFSGREKVRKADRSLVTVFGIGFIDVTPFMLLSSFLHVPDFAANLLSIACVTHDLNCRAIFYSRYCFFHDLVTGKIIGRDNLRNGIYYLDFQPRTCEWLIQAYHIVWFDDSTAKV